MPFYEASTVKPEKCLKTLESTSTSSDYSDKHPGDVKDGSKKIL